jgi:predicted CopG family antitoxin
MENTTIALNKDLKERISEFGNKGESFSDILERLLKSAEQRLFHDLLMSRDGCATIEEAIKEAEGKWPK